MTSALDRYNLMVQVQLAFQKVRYLGQVIDSIIRYKEPIANSNYVHRVEMVTGKREYNGKFNAVIKTLDMTESYNTWPVIAREIMAMYYASQFVLFDISPHFTLLYNHFKEKKSYILIQEYIPYEATKILNEPSLTETDYIHLFFQIISSLLGMTVFLDIVHNDIKSDNVLFIKHSESKRIYYQIFGKIYTLSSKYSARIMDWGSATGDSVFTDHQELPEIAQKDQIEIESWDHYNNLFKHLGQRHVMYFRSKGKYIDTYKRDFLMTCYMFLIFRKQANFPLQYFKTAVSVIHHFHVSKRTDLIALFHHLFASVLTPISVHHSNIKPNYCMDDYMKCNTKKILGMTTRIL